MVDNIGCVYVGNNKAEALRHFREYRDQSLRGYGRAAHESVRVFEDTEPTHEHDTSPENTLYSSDGKRRGYFTGARRQCRQIAGCKGQQLQVRWEPKGSITWPCSAGLVEVDDKTYIGPVSKEIEELAVKTITVPLRRLLHGPTTSVCAIIEQEPGETFLPGNYLLLPLDQMITVKLDVRASAAYHNTVSEQLARMCSDVLAKKEQIPDCPVCGGQREMNGRGGFVCYFCNT